MEILVIGTTPAGFAGWTLEQQAERYDRAVQWHDYAERLHDSGQMPWVWGTHQLIDATRMSCTVSANVAIYRTESLREYDALFDEDPLRDVSHYMTIPLSPLADDQQHDHARFETVRDQLMRQKDAYGRAAYELYRSLFRGAPEFVGKYEQVAAPNEPVGFDRAAADDDCVEVMLYGINPDAMIELWDDTRKLIHYEKVEWWHDYTAMLIHEGKATHVWGTHDFCSIDTLQAKSAGAVTVIRAKDYDEFDNLYKLDPIRDATLFQSIVLRPVSAQRESDIKRRDRARARLSGR